MTGALVAAGVAWGSILAAIALPLDRVLDPRALRLGGAGTLALVAFQILGFPVPAALPLGFFAVALAGGVLLRVLAARRPAAREPEA